MPTNGYVAGTLLQLKGGYVVASKKTKIEEWFDLKLQEFAEIENQNMNLLTPRWLNRYIYDDPYEWLFCEFSVVLYEWIG